MQTNDEKIYNSPHVNPQVDPDEIDLTELLGKLLRKKKFIIITTLIFMILGVLIAKFSPNQYTASCTVVPQSSDSRGSKGGLAAMAGINLGGSGASDGILSPYTYGDIVKSVPFTLELMQTPINTPRAGGETITLYDYYANPEYRKVNPIGVIKKYTIGLPGVIIRAIRGEQTPAGEGIDLAVHKLNRGEQIVYEIIQNSINVNVDDKNRVVRLSYVFGEPVGAAQITEQLRITLSEYVKQFKSEKAEETLQFIEENYDEAQTDFRNKQRALAQFQDANRALTTATARATEQHLQNEYNIAFTVYNELARQREQAKIAVKESSTLLTVIRPVVVPSQKSAPRSMLILIAFTMLGIVVSIGWVLAWPPLKEMIQNAKQQ